MRRRRGLTLLDESKKKVPVNSLDDLPSHNGFSMSEINDALNDHNLVEHHILWANYLSNQTGYFKSSINLDIYLPNGYIFALLSPLHWTLKYLKEQLFKYVKSWIEEQGIEPDDYIFSSVGDNGELLELYDEERSLDAVHMFLPFLILVKRNDFAQETELNEKIGLIIDEPLKQLEPKLNPELKNFRLELFESIKRADDERGTSGTFHYAFPEETILPNIADRVFSPNIHSEVHEEDVEFWWYPSLPSDADQKAMQALKKKVERSRIGIEVWYRENEESEQGISVGIKEIFDKTPSDIIRCALNMLGKRDNPAEFILQVVGRNAFVTLHKPILKFEYIRSCFENYREPKLLLRRKNVIFAQFPPPPEVFTPSYIRADEFSRKYPCTTKLKPACFWDLDQVLSIIIRGISNIQEYDSVKLYVKTILAAGRHILDSQDTAPVASNSFRQAAINFNVYMKDVPESAQMCFLLYSASKKSSADDEMLAYMNVRLFDWKNMFCQGKNTFYLRPPPKGADVASILLLPCGSNICHNSVRLEVEFPEVPGRELEFPDWEIIEKFSQFTRCRQVEEEENNVLEPILRDSDVLEKFLKLRNELDGSKLTIDDQNFLWDYRLKIQELFPQMILILADTPLVYSCREKLCEFYNLLNTWPQLYVDTAIELLDARFSDRYVRAFAVRHLDKIIDNDQMQLYLLALVQCLRYEPYATSPLADMLVRRALMDYKVGHTFLWLMRSELALFSEDDPMCLKYRFALMCEAYCRGNALYLNSMTKQVMMVNKLTELSTLVKAFSKEVSSKKLQAELVDCVSGMQNMQSPLNPCECLGEIDISACKVLGSAKMPLRLRWKNPEPFSQLTNPVHEIIFKNGDDLRQDMLTLQVMRIMDAKWKNYNMDYCLTVYEVLPMGENIGMIHVVQNCATIFQIQCASTQLGSTFSMDQQLINKHIYDLCTQDKVLNSKKYMECVDRFSFSLAGYCVATYVLGIRDRHQDNLMLANDGRLFHIDFGHILGHNKKKLGINRERTDFILTDHFLCVVSHGKDDFKGSYMFKTFRESCAQGYLVLHYHRRFFLALFKMMRCMGLPELQRDEDIEYMYTSLQYEKVERQSILNSFFEVFDGVVKHDWSTTVNWFFHSVKHHK
ncbi:unnamed protein product [Bursaphelenchus okinawaensis]|uniref:Phosphatidylinositol-4,5-bisphosphate 3-kinase n=1 Tax=Bursaphelenchus okinawaensis TaxID=465554 RepID=A0A811JTQ3_9BILA|nr:unnamed protein product [Bursaphelenchus okinawaensis]CAG9082642.1 unnamed protein product [Bursaphelenchus okinawaensis]